MIVGRHLLRAQNTFLMRLLVKPLPSALNAMSVIHSFVIGEKLKCTHVLSGTFVQLGSGTKGRKRSIRTEKSMWWADVIAKSRRFVALGELHLSQLFSMRIAGFEPFTLLDYPGKLACVVFTPGCVLRCPYCHNPELIIPQKNSQQLFFDNREEAFFAFLRKRKGKLDGVCITGGEPTIHRDIVTFIRRIKTMGFLVKLDTNGAFPEIVKTIMKTKLVDYWAMDIKHAPDKYGLATGNAIAVKNFIQSVEIIMDKAPQYEFRTTAVAGIHEETDFMDIAAWIAGAQSYYLQAFRDGKVFDPSVSSMVAKESILDLDHIQSLVKNLIPNTFVRR